MTFHDPLSKTDLQSQHAMTSNDLEWFRLNLNDLQWPQMTTNDLKWPQMTSNDPILLNYNTSF